MEVGSGFSLQDTVRAQVGFTCRPGCGGPWVRGGAEYGMR